MNNSLLVFLGHIIRPEIKKTDMFEANPKLICPENTRRHNVNRSAEGNGTVRKSRDVLPYLAPTSVIHVGLFHSIQYGQVIFGGIRKTGVRRSEGVMILDSRNPSVKSRLIDIRLKFTDGSKNGEFSRSA